MLVMMDHDVVDGDDGDGDIVVNNDVVVDLAVVSNRVDI